MEFDQRQKDLEYLNHVLRNSTARIAGCLKEIEITLLEMGEAVKGFREGREEEQLAQRRRDAKEEGL
jgi:hypothetical protein